MTETVDVVLIGGGIMSATLGTLLSELQPDWKIVVYERLHDVGLESSNAWNNAGTGHAALCELNYMPEGPTARSTPPRPSRSTSSSSRAASSGRPSSSEGVLERPSTFINSTPHMTFVRGEKDVAYLKTRYEALKEQPLFAGIEYSEDSRVINKWAPLLMQKRRAGEPFAATRVPAGTDVDFGALTHQLFDNLRERGAEVVTNREVRGLKRQSRRHLADQVAQLDRPHARRDPGALRVRRRGRLGAQAAAALRHPRDHGLRRVPDRRAVPQDDATPRSSPSTRRRSTRRRRSARRRCRCRTSTRAWSTARHPCCSDRSRRSARSSSRTARSFDLVAQVRPSNLVADDEGRDRQPRR